MGINPAHFCRASASSLSTVVFPVSDCSNVWPRFSWQNNDQVSHEELAYAIQSAEHDLTDLVGYFPSPDWVEQEVHMMPREFDRQYFSDGLDIRGQLMKIDTNYRKAIAFGKRALTKIATCTTADGSLSYQDYDGDGLFEIALISVATTQTNVNELKVYFAGMSGSPEWEIRPVRYHAISGGILTIKIDSWFLIDPEQLSAYPTDAGFRAIDISTAANFVTSVDVYREYNDNTVASTDFVWQGTDLPTACDLFDASVNMTNTQTGTGLVVDGERGIVMPVPATYDAGEAKWTTTVWAEDYAPDYTRLYYYSGEYSDAFLRGFSTEPLSDFWAQTIAWVATARLTRPLCGCQSVADLAEKMSEDLALTDNGRSIFTPVEIVRNPLGTRRGEVMAWRRISKLVRDRRSHYAVI
jgi:hypothetical protein